MNYDQIRKDFYKEYSEEELSNIIYKMLSSKNESLDYISDVGVNATSVLSHWFDRILYKAKRVNNTLSPAEALESDECLDKIFSYIKTKPNFYKGDDVTNLKAYFRNSQSSVVNASKVANFSPIAAKKIYERYCPNFYATILDYSCGFGARLLGCLTSSYDYKYIGIEPNTELNTRLKQFSSWVCQVLHKEDKTKIYLEGSEVFHPELVETVDLSFSSPPYFNLEIYCDEETQSANKNTSYKAWLESYMIPTIQNIYKYTKPGGVHIVNLKNLTTAGKEPLLDNWIKCCLSVGFKLESATYLTHQSRRQFDKGKSNVNFHADKEPIIVFKKVS